MEAKIPKTLSLPTPLREKKSLLIFHSKFSAFSLDYESNKSFEKISCMQQQKCFSPPAPRMKTESAFNKLIHSMIVFLSTFSCCYAAINLLRKPFTCNFHSLSIECLRQSRSSLPRLNGQKINQSACGFLQSNLRIK